MKALDQNRRDFLAGTGQLAGAGWLALNMPALLLAGEAAAAQRSAGEGWKNITPQEAATLTAIVDQIIPPDDLPGASQAGVVYYIDNVLGGFMSGSAEMLRQGVAELDRSGFSGLSFEQQTGILENIEETPFFRTMIFMTHCGMFAMPSWGGNRDLSGWKLLGFDNRHAWQPPFGYYDARAAAGESNDERG